MNSRLIRTLAGPVITAALLTSAAPASAAPQSGRWSQSAGEASAINFQVASGRVSSVTVLMNVGCVNADGSIVSPSPTYEFVSPEPVRIARGRWTRVDFRDSAAGFDVKVSIRFTGRRSARAHVYASSIADSPACEGTDKFHHVRAG